MDQKEKLSQKEVWNVIAPKWNEYRNNPKKEILNFLKNQTGNILDFGSGSGRYLTNISGGKIHLVDFSKKMIDLAKEKAKEKNISAEFFVSNLSKLPFKNNFFNGAIFIDSLHCVETEENRENSIKELFRVLKPRSKAFLSVWNKNQKRFKNSKKEKFIGWEEKVQRYYYLYDEIEIHKLFKDIGFKIIETFPSNKKIMFIAQKP